MYDKFFGEYNRTVAQVLLTGDVVSNPHSKQNVVNTFQELIGMQIIPVCLLYTSSIRHAMAKNFFSILKSECIRIYKPETILEVQTFIDEYITIYNNESIPLSTKRSLFEKRRLFAQFAVILRLAVLFLSFPSGTVQLLGGLALFLQGTEKGKHFPKYLGLGKLFAIFLWILRFSTCNGRLECRIIMMNNIILYMGGDGICRRSVRGWARLKIILFYRLSRFCLC